MPDGHVARQVDRGVKKGKKVKNNKVNWSVISYVSAFLIGVILFWSFGKNWLNLESALVLLAGLIGVAISVLIFGAWNTRNKSNHKIKLRTCFT